MCWAALLAVGQKFKLFPTQLCFLSGLSICSTQPADKKRASGELFGTISLVPTDVCNFCLPCFGWISGTWPHLLRGDPRTTASRPAWEKENGASWLQTGLFPACLHPHASLFVFVFLYCVTCYYKPDNVGQLTSITTCFPWGRSPGRA